MTDTLGNPELTYLNMEQIANLMRRDHGVDNAYVEHTGGGVMCLYAGPTHVRESDGAELYAVCFGPGRLVMGSAVADRDDVYWGPDGDDDDALTALTVFPDWRTITEAELARVLANYIRMAQEIEANAFGGDQ